MVYLCYDYGRWAMLQCATSALTHVLYTPFSHFSSHTSPPFFSSPRTSLLLPPSSSAPLPPSYPHKEYCPAHLECDPGMDLVLMPFQTDSVEEFFARLEAARTLHRMICPGRVLRVVFVADYSRTF